jgi:predicted deacylase
MVKVGTVTAQKGERAFGKIKVGELSNRLEVFIPVMILNGNKEGPTFWMNGAVHGDELNGLIAMRRVIFDLNPGELSGTIICTPISNPMGFQGRSKLNPIDSLDLDQQFPGSAGGSFTERIAYELFAEIKDKANYLISFHTIGTPYAAKPYVVYKTVPNVRAGLNEEMKKMAFTFGVYANCNVDIATAAGENPGPLNASIDVQCALHGIPAMMAEIGGGGRLENQYIEVAVTGIHNLLKYAGMIPGKPEVPGEQIHVTSRKHIRCSSGGMAIMDVVPGQFLKKGESIARIIDVGSEKSEIETFQADRDMYIISARVNPPVDTGDRIVFVALEWKKHK